MDDKELETKRFPVAAAGRATLLACALWLAIVQGANATLIDYGTAEGITFRDCIAGTSGCDSVSDPVSIAYGGSPGAPSSDASRSLAGYGTATGSVSLSGTIGAPILRGSASSEPGTRQNTNSVALQSYTYTGTEPTTRTFGGTLTYSQSLTGSYPYMVGNGVFAVIDIFTLSVDMIDVGDTPASNFAALSNETLLPGYVSLASGDYSDTTSTTSGYGTVSATVDLTPGETIWVYVLLQTPAVNGGTVDASHTLITRWDDPEGLVPSIVASVPEPATFALVGLGLVALGWSRSTGDGKI